MSVKIYGAKPKRKAIIETPCPSGENVHGPTFLLSENCLDYGRTDEVLGGWNHFR